MPWNQLSVGTHSETTTTTDLETGDHYAIFKYVFIIMYIHLKTAKVILFSHIWLLRLFSAQDRAQIRLNIPVPHQ